MIFPTKYKALSLNIFQSGEFQIVPIRYKDRLDIMKWRNEQMYHLRQSELLTEEIQEDYFKNNIAKLFTKKKPNQILFSFLKNNNCVGYGGLVHIDWENKSSEISFIMNTSLEANYFEIFWDNFLILIERVAFNNLDLQKISTYAYDIRPHIYKIFEKNGFINTITLKDKYLFNNKSVDVVIHTKNKISDQGNDIGNVLITSVASKTPLIKNVRDAVNKINSNIKIYAGDIDKDCIGKFFVDTFWEMPSISEIKPNQFKDYCIKNNIKLVIPSRDGELLFFSKIKDFLKSFGIHVMISNEKSIRNCIDKLAFYYENRTTISEIIETNSNIELLKPCKYYVVKERYGAGALSIGIRLDKKSSVEHAKTLSDPVFQPFVDGEEFSVDAYVDSNNTIKGIIIRKRVKIVNGESQVTTSSYNKDLELQCKKVIRKLHLYGHIILQAIVTDQQVYVIECNARFGGASSLSIYKGLDSFYWSYLEALDIDITNYPFIKSEKEVTQVKYVDTKYIISQ